MHGATTKSWEWSFPAISDKDKNSCQGNGSARMQVRHRHAKGVIYSSLNVTLLVISHQRNWFVFLISRSESVTGI
jgi:hypothetical protein